MRLLTTSEAAEYLRLKERKLYELISEGQVPCTKVTGKWLFPKDELDLWLASSLIRPEGMPATEPMPIVGGSHDPLLEWSLRESGCALATLPEGSEAGLQRFARGELVATAIHLHDLESQKVDANIIAMRSRARFHDAALLAFARREQGILVPLGNSKNLTCMRDIIQTRARVAQRPAGAGAQLLLESLLHREDAGLDQLNIVLPASPTGSDLAQAIRAGRADCGIATRSAATAAGLDFIPIVWEHFDIVVRQRDYFRKPIQSFLAFLRRSDFAHRAAEMGGYDVSEAGNVRYAP
ncbi:MAG: helix-turn-helix transcriptional regulator [Pseudorhodoplanes sp.]|jgi:excisionase family DNA binding protein|nr:helix-turn-helix transcriptional regulator [Pseudorhodoplanes sp.]